MSFKTAYSSLAAAALLAAVTGFSGGVAQAATMIGFEGDKKATPYMEDGFSFAPSRIVNGNCASGQCAVLNNNKTMVMTNTLPTTGSPFAFQSMWFQLLGKGTPNTLFVTDGTTTLDFDVADYPHNNGGQTIDFVSDHTNVFGNVTEITFYTNGGGNVRIDDLMVAPVPLPAAAWLLIGGVGALGAAARRRKAQAA